MTSDATASTHWFEELADHLGSAYLRYSFTYGTDQEVDFLVEKLGLEPGMRVLDVGCGPGRHARALGDRGLVVHGIDLSETFVGLAKRDAPPGVTFERADARHMQFDGSFDAVISLCQGAFGLCGGPSLGGVNEQVRSVPTLDPDLDVLEGMSRAARPGGAVAFSAFSSYFQVRFLEVERDHFDAGTGVNRERTEIRDDAGARRQVDLWTSCFTPRELKLMVDRVGLDLVDLWSVTPGEYAERAPDLDHPEYLVVARRPLA